MKRYRWIIIVAVLIPGFVLTEYFGHHRVVPPDQVKSLDGFLAWKPSAEEFAVVDTRNGEYLIAYGPANSLLGLSSGPSAYAFDRSGRLVDWSADIGDDPRFDERWQAQSARGGARHIARAKAATWPATRPGG